MSVYFIRYLLFRKILVVFFMNIVSRTTAPRTGAPASPFEPYNGGSKQVGA